MRSGSYDETSNCVAMKQSIWTQTSKKMLLNTTSLVNNKFSQHSEDAVVLFCFQ